MAQTPAGLKDRLYPAAAIISAVLVQSPGISGYCSYEVLPSLRKVGVGWKMEWEGVSRLLGPLFFASTHPTSVPAFKITERQLVGKALLFRTPGLVSWSF